MLPDIVDNSKFNYLKVNNKYIQSISIKSLPDNIFFLDIVKDLPYNLEFDFTIFIHKLDPIKTLNDITFSIGTAQSELNTINSNQRNIDIINKSKEDASLLRRKLQVENQEIYNISIIYTFYSYNFSQLIKIISSIKSKFYSKGIISEITNFRHLEFYLYNLPLNTKNDKFLNKIYLTTNALSNIFPFYITNIIDEKGVIAGYTERNSLCMIDIFSKKYENSNMCIFGCSGSGKSYFIKLFIIRNFFLGKKQIVFDIEDEYGSVCNNLEGQILFKDTYFNILEITNTDINRDNYLDYKVNKIVSFISNFCDINKEYIKNKLYRLYKKFNITNDVYSVYSIDNTNKVSLDNKIRNKESFPTLVDLINIVDDVDQKSILNEVINKELKYFARTTNIDINNSLFILDMKNISNMSKIFTVIIQEILENYLGKHDTIIYIDEVWKYLKEDETANCVFNLYKTIRKKKAAIITATQDIEDFFEYKNGLYSNSILNNSCFKVIFKINLQDNKRFLNNFNLDNISFLKKGEAIVNIDRNNIKLKIKANDFEREIINENDIITIQ